MRYVVLNFLILSLAIYVWKDWYKALCGLIVMMAFIEHPDMPKTMFGIQGLNPWNMLLAIIVIAWMLNRKSEGLKWDMPRNINMLLIVYLAVIMTGFFRMLSDTAGLEDFARIWGVESPSQAELWSENILNTIKWVIPGALLFDGCRGRSRLIWAICSILAVYFLLGAQIVRWMPLDDVMNGDLLSRKGYKRLDAEIGYHRVDLAAMLAGAFWALLAARQLAPRKSHAIIISGASVLVVLALTLTGGRTGYGTWAVVGITMGLLLWRKYIVLIPVMMAAIALAVPSVYERASQGFSNEEHVVEKDISDIAYFSDSKYDYYSITSGRNVAWPFVVEKIAESPLLGYGRMAMQRTGIATQLLERYGEQFPHPHNAYLELLLDAGLIGFIPIMWFYYLLIKYSLALARDPAGKAASAIGAVALALVMAQLVASVGSQSFYPREGTVGMWCSIGVMLRVYLERLRTHDGSALAIFNMEMESKRVGKYELAFNR